MHNCHKMALYINVLPLAGTLTISLLPATPVESQCPTICLCVQQYNGLTTEE